MSPPPAEQLAARIFIGPALRAQPDRRLVDLVRDGYDAAFEEIVRRYRKPLDRFAAGIVGGRAEDVTQDSFSKALLALRGSEAEIELRPWLYRIVRNTALNDLRDRAPAAEELSERLPGGRSAAAEAEAREDLRDLMQRLQALPEPQRAALVMRELEGLGHEEIAAALGVSRSAARQAIYRARAALREGFGLLMPLPALRALAERGTEVGAAGGTIAAGGALKAGMATMLIAGAVGAGVAIDHHHGERPGPEAAEAAPLAAGKQGGAGGGRNQASGQSSSPRGTDNHGRGSGDRGGDDSTGHRSSDSPGGGSLSGSGDGPGPPSGDSHSGEGSGHSGSGSGEDGSRHSGSGASGSGDSGSGSGDRHGDSSGSDDLSGSNSGSGSGDSGTSGSSGSDDSFSSSDGGSGDSSGGETVPEPTGEPTLSESGSDGGGTSGGSDSGTSGSGSGDLTTSTSTSDGGS